MGCLGIGAIVSAQSNRSAQNNATNANQQNVQNTNAQNFNMFQQSRGSQGSAVFPTYLKNPDGSTFESTMGTNAMGLYDAAGGGMSPAAQIALYQALQTQFQPTQAAANTTAEGIFNGDLTNQELADYAPVAAAQQAGVAAQKEGSIEGLQQTLNQIKAIQAGQGFSGDSLGNRMLTSNALRSTNGGNAALQSASDVNIAQTRQGIQEGGIQRQLSNLNLPNAMFQENTAFANGPNNAAIAQEGQRQQLFNQFRIGTGQFQYQNLPTVQPNPNLFSAIGAAGSAVGSGMTNYFTSKANGAGGGGAAAAAGGGYVPNQSGLGYTGPGSYSNTAATDGGADDFGTVNAGQVGQYQAINTDTSGNYFGGSSDFMD